MEENEELELKQDSYTEGSSAKGGSLKIYFNAKNLAETQTKIENFFKIKEFIRKLGGGL